MEKMDFKTADGVDANIEKLAQIFPEAVTETKDANGKLVRVANLEALKTLLEGKLADPNEQECYEFIWPGKSDAIMEAAKSITKTLRPCPEESKNWDSTQNLYIEGDNLEALKLLQQSYLGKVKMIYIDPPYNTGKDFVYRDNFHKSSDEFEEETTVRDEDDNKLVQNTESNGRFHSDWCSMIYPRLKLARDLLSDDGVIFISIDDHEVHNLRKICDEIFGSTNFRNTIIVRRRIKSLNSQFAGNGLATMNVAFEYILVYAKSDSFLMEALRQKKVESSIKGRWDVFWSNADRPTMRYDILGFTPATGQWRNSREKAEIAINNYKKYLEEYSEKMSLEEYYALTGIKDFIRRIPNAVGKNGGVQHWVAPSDSMLRTSNWTDIEVSQIGKEIDIPFDNPKNKLLIIELAKLIRNDRNFVVIDFFSGFSTTAHAVMQLNAKDGGNRKFIMVQLPEKTDEKSEAFKAGYKNICEIGKERIRRAGEKIKAEYATTAPNLDIGFRVLKVAESNMKDVYYSPAQTSQDLLDSLESNIKEDRTDLDLLFACLIDFGVELSLPLKSETIDGVSVHTVQSGEIPDIIACFAENIPESVVREIASRQPLRAVFRDSSFKDSPSKINVKEIFKYHSPNTTIKVL